PIVIVFSAKGAGLYFRSSLWDCRRAAHLLPLSKIRVNPCHPWLNSKNVRHRPKTLGLLPHAASGPQPGRAKENSPAIYRWVSMPWNVPQSRVATSESSQTRQCLVMPPMEFSRPKRPADSTLACVQRPPIGSLVGCWALNVEYA